MRVAICGAHWKWAKHVPTPRLSWFSPPKSEFSAPKFQISETHFIAEKQWSIDKFKLRNRYEIRFEKRYTYLCLPEIARTLFSSSLQPPHNHWCKVPITSSSAHHSSSLCEGNICNRPSVLGSPWGVWIWIEKVDYYPSRIRVVSETSSDILT